MTGKSLSLRKLWPAVVCYLVMMAISMVFARYMHFGGWPRVINTVFPSFIMGELLLVIVLSGLLGRTWIAGWMFGVVLVWITIALFALTDWGWDNIFDEEFLGIASFFPLATLAASAPLVAMRGLRGWSLTLSDQLEVPRDTPNVEDLFLLSIVVASCVTLSRWMTELLPGPPDGAQFVALGVIMVLSLVVVLPATAVTFLTRTWPQRLIAWLGMSIIVLITGVLFNVIPAWWQGFSGPDFLPDLLVGVGVGSLTAMIGAAALLASGLRLTRFAPARPANDSPWDEQPEAPGEPSGRRARRQARWLTAMAVLVAGLSTAGLSLADYRRLQLYRAMQSQAPGGPAVARTLVSDGQPVGLQFHSEATDNDVVALVGSSTKQLLLSKTKITDAALDKLSERAAFDELDLSHTNITNAGLEKLAKLKTIVRLSLAHTQVDLDVALRIASKLNVQHLDVSGLGITDQDIPNQLDSGSLWSIKLRDNPISDTGVAELLKKIGRPLQALDLADTLVTGSCLVSTVSPASVCLDGTKITDANLISYIKLGNCRSVSLARTGITPGVLRSLSVQNLSLTLGSGSIGEADLEILSNARFSRLALNDPQFTGQCLLSGRIQANSVDLSHSAVTDETVAQLLRLGYLSHLSLAYTNVSDKALPSLTCYSLDIRGTRMTANGLRQASSISMVVVTPEQFTPEELASLKRMRIVFNPEELRHMFGF